MTDHPRKDQEMPENTATPPARERLETRYLVYETDDMGRTLKLITDQLAGSSSQALSRAVPAGDQRVVTAVSENHLRLRVPPPKIVLADEPEPAAPAQEALAVAGEAGE